MTPDNSGRARLVRDQRSHLRYWNDQPKVHQVGDDVVNILVRLRCLFVEQILVIADYLRGG